MTNKYVYDLQFLKKNSRLEFDAEKKVPKICVLTHKDMHDGH